MAEVRPLFGTRAYDFAHLVCRRNLMESPKKLSKSGADPSSFIATFLLDDFQHGGLSGADHSADTVTGVVSRGDDPQEARLCVGGKYSVPGHYSHFNLEEGSLSYKRTKGRDFRRTSCSSILAHRHRVCNVNASGQFLFIRTLSGNGRRSEPLYKTKTGYYDILEVPPTATQIQIKTAYYKQSFIYHPDRNAGSEEATTRFSAISEAYTVLGNKALRKRYDRGLLSQSDLTAAARPSTKDATGSSSKPQAESRRSDVGDQIRGSVFNFDKFYKTHYSEQLQRQRDIRVRKEDMLRRKQETLSEKKLGKMLEMAVAVLMGVGLLIMISLKRG
ncbi:hypothetical protein Q5P01_020229 [Channa striata]|uniref:DnaJ homolog subfamily C member 30, mitochondrial n=1 Tax=Channa striata TaxID=64152 RepID=A0AA88S8R7_CHASR|nr:hypothetical protein Q5P01_020229 [Channa striata]